MLIRTLRLYTEQRGVTSTASTPSAAALWRAASTDFEFNRRGTPLPAIFRTKAASTNPHMSVPLTSRCCPRAPMVGRSHRPSALGLRCWALDQICVGHLGEQQVEGTGYRPRGVTEPALSTNLVLAQHVPRLVRRVVRCTREARAFRCPRCPSCPTPTTVGENRAARTSSGKRRRPAAG
jgi:hypothetical protein